MVTVVPEPLNTNAPVPLTVSRVNVAPRPPTVLPASYPTVTLPAMVKVWPPPTVMVLAVALLVLTRSAPPNVTLLVLRSSVLAPLDATLPVAAAEATSALVFEKVNVVVVGTEAIV